MNDQLFRTFQCLTMLGLDPLGCLAEMEANGITTQAALEAMLAHPPSGALTPGLAMTRCGAGLAQGRPELFGILAGILGQSGIHPLSMLNWEGWEPDLALELLQEHWQGQGRAPLPLIGLGHVACAELRTIPHGLHLQRLRLVHCRDLRSLPEGLQVQEGLELRSLGLHSIPSSLRCGGNLVLADLPFLESWGSGIRIGGDLIINRVPRMTKLSDDLIVGGERRMPAGWAQSSSVGTWFADLRRRWGAPLIPST
jgi:hypothetical protein